MNFSFFHYMLGNGLANIYIHNWIRMDPLLIKDRKPLQHVATLVRQGCFDLVLVVENVVLLWIALHSEINELKDNRLAFSSVLLGFTLIGLILKWVYYRYVSTIYYINQYYTLLNVLAQPFIEEVPIKSYCERNVHSIFQWNFCMSNHEILLCSFRNSNETLKLGVCTAIRSK